ncbi:MAG TPA: hypothetical protein VNO30_34355 [Kofleriaceae bacterium]|nr:hypothetical protein [Kofleriaceae bacterium]
MFDECNIARVDRYRLAPLRDARDRDERARRGALAAAVDDARAAAGGEAQAQHRVDLARARLAAAARAPAELLARGAAPPALLALAERHAARLRRELDAAVGAHLRAAAAHQGQLAAVDEARGRLALARADRELIERHFARWRAAQRKRSERRAD